MMKTKTLLAPFTTALALLASACVLAAGTPEYEVSATGMLSKLAVGGDSLAFAPGGGFSARDVVAKKSIDLSRGALTKSNGKTTFKSATSDGITLQAEFTPNDAGYIQVNGFIENASGGDRAIILDYRLCLPGDDLVFSCDLNKDQDVALAKAKDETEANAFPLAALGAPGKTAVSIAIPWNDPLIFGVAGEGNALIMRLYLGLSPLPRAFPNKASFSFIIYPSRADWGFRGSLEKYYQFYPDRYEPHTKDAGFYMYMEKGYVPENIKQFSYNVVEIQNPHFQYDLDRNEKHNITSLVYTIVGQREVKFLPKMLSQYDEGITALANWKHADHAAHPITKESSASEGDPFLRDEIENCAVRDSAGKYIIMFRNTHWGKNSATFRVNPSPWLFADKPDRQAVGKNTFAAVNKWLARYPQVKGVIVDSLGGRWPAVLNYRQDHMEYVRYPLTFDSQGRLAIHNVTSHYEWVQGMHDMLAPQGKLLSANGVYTYQTIGPEHFRAGVGRSDRASRIKVGRFFISALLDTAASESGGKTPTDRCQDLRLMLGRKYYAMTNYKWEDREDTEAFFNRCLSLALFATNNRDPHAGGEYQENGFEGLDYYSNPKGYGRDKALLDWFLPKARMLFKAGWEPATLARKTVGNDKIYIERYGKGDSIYFTIFNDNDQEAEVGMKLDLSALGFTEGTADFEEVATDAKLEIISNDEVRFKLPPRRTCIVRASPVLG